MDFKAENTFPAISYHLYDEDVALDVLLDMCSKKQLSIKDIFISDITEQFIQYVSIMIDKDYEEISNFLVLAATLLEIKSNELLPKIDFSDVDPNALSDAEIFVLKTEEYALYRDVANKLKEIEILNRFYRDPEFDENEYKLVIKNFDISKMVNAFSSLLENVEFREDPSTTKTIPLERFTVVDRMRYITEYLRAYKSTKLVNLFDKDFSRVEIINTFLAVLELVKEQYIGVFQEGENINGIELNYIKSLLNEEEIKEEIFESAEGYN